MLAFPRWIAAASANRSACRSASSFSIASRSSLLRRPTARGLYFSVGFEGSPGPVPALGPGPGPMLPEGLRFLRDCNRCTGARVVVPGAGLAEVLGVGLEPDSPPLLFRAGADDAPRLGPALGGIMMVVSRN